MGQTPIVPRLGSRYSVNMLSAITAQGEMRFMLHEGRVTDETFSEFLRCLVVGMDRPIFVIVDGHSLHGAKRVKQLSKEYEGKLKLFFVATVFSATEPRRMGMEQRETTGGQTLYQQP